MPRDELRRARIRLGFTGLKLAMLAGVTPATIFNYESGKRGTRVDARESLRGVIDVLQDEAARRGLDPLEFATYVLAPDVFPKPLATPEPQAVAS